MREHQIFNIKEFLNLLEKKQQGLTTDDEDRYLRHLIATNDEAEYWYKLYIKLFPKPRLNLGRKRASTTNYPVIILALLLLCISVLGYIYLRKKTAPVHHTVQRFSGASFKNIIEQAENDYNVQIVFDQIEISEMHASGVLAPDKISLSLFLDQLTLPAGLKYYKDSSGIIHICK